MARNPQAGTAFGPVVIAAVEQHEPPTRRLVDDDLAAHFLPLPLRAFVRATRWSPIRGAVMRATERAGPGLWANIACRKHYIDDNLDSARSDIDAVVVLGAGLDTRGCRLARDGDVPVFEVDLPINVARKRDIVTRVLGAVPPTLHLVPIDFERDRLMSVLAGQGYRSDARTFFIWEGVTQYLSEAGVRATFDQLAGAATGSHICFTYVRSNFIDGTDLYGAPALYRRFRQRTELWRYALPPDGVADFLTTYGWRLIAQAGPDEFQARYVRPAGRDTATSEIEWSTHADKC